MITGTDKSRAEEQAGSPAGGPALGQRVVKGGALLGGASGLEHGLRLVRNMVLARILAPEDFGTMAIVLAVGMVFETVTEVGIKQAVIQNPKGTERAYLNGAWWLSAVRGTFLYLALFASAPWVARFYDDPGLVPLMRVAFLAVFFKGIMSIRSYVALKEMRFGRWILIYQGGALIGILTCVGLAFYLRNVWALVVGFTLEAGARCLLSYIVTPFRPGFVFDRESAKKLFSFSKGMMGLPIMTFIFMRADIFIVGKLRPFAELGLYSMVATLARMPFLFLTSVLGQVMAPAFSSIQTDRTRVNRSVLHVTHLIAGVGYPAFVFSALFGRELINAVYGPEYGAIVVPFVIVFAAELVRTEGLPIATVYMMSGRPDLHRLFTVVRVVIILILLYPAIQAFGLLGAAASGLIAVSVGHVVQVRRMKAFTGMEILPYVSLHFRPLAASLIVVASWLATNFLRPVSPPVFLGIGLLGFTAAAAVAVPSLGEWRRLSRPPAAAAEQPAGVLDAEKSP